MLVLAVALGGAVGAVSRYGLSGYVQALWGTSFPMGTMAVNVIGSFLLGLALPMFDTLAWSAEVRTIVTIGFLGAFTTFSTFSYEAVLLLQGGEWGRGVAYMGGSLILGILGILSGMALASVLLQARA